MKKTHFIKNLKQSGAKKYCYIEEIEKKDIDITANVLKENENGSVDALFITVAGVPKQGSHCLHKIEDFKDNLIFDAKVTNKNMLFYVDEQEEREITDYQGNTYKVTDKSGCCLVPCSYKLSKSLEYSELISDNSSKRAKYIENKEKRC